MAYLVIAYPDLTKNDFDKIQHYREQNDKLFFKIVDPHFTIVFPIFDMTENEFVNEVRLQATNIEKFSFKIRCSTINKDRFSDHYHAFLVPDEGFSNIVKLHDKMYCDKLRDNLRLDIDFIPHIGIGNSLDKFFCKSMVDEWNSIDFLIAGSISKLTIVKYENDKGITEIENINLK
jgi:hypothetical protein